MANEPENVEAAVLDAATKIGDGFATLANSIPGLRVYGERNRFLAHVAIIIGIFLLGMTIVIVYLLLRVDHVANAAKRNTAKLKAAETQLVRVHDFAVAQCQTINKIKVNDVGNWAAAIQLTPPPPTQAQRAASALATSKFIMHLQQSDAPDDCSKIP